MSELTKPSKENPEGGARNFVEEGPTVSFVSSCSSCVLKHLDKATCDAFPGGIPQVIIDGGEKHFTPFPGDSDIVYKPDPAMLQREA